MPGPITRDSIAKSAPANDLYAMIRNPSAKMPTSVKQVDTIKSLQAQMERDAIAQLGKSMQKFIFVARAGKFVFLAITMPPYILLYGLPKWILMDALPIIFHHVSNPFKLAHDKIKKLFKTNENDKGVLSTLKNALTTISTKAAEYIKWIDRTSKALFVHMKHQIVALGYRLLQPSLPLFQKGAQAAEAATKLLQKTYGKGEKHAELARQFVSFAWKIAKQECAHQMRPFTEMVKNKFNDIHKRTSKLIEKPHLEIQKFKKAVAHKLKQVNEVLKSTGQRISKNTAYIGNAIVSFTARPLIEWASPKMEWTGSMFRAGVDKMAQNFEKIRGFVQNIASGVMDAARLSREVVTSTVKNIFEAVTPAFVKQFFNPEGGFKKKTQQMIENIGQKIKKLKKVIIQLAVNSLDMSRRKLFAFMLAIQKFFKQLPSRLFNLAITTYRLIIRSFIKIGHFLRWVGFWSRVLCRLAWIELRETTALFIKESRKQSS